MGAREDALPQHLAPEPDRVEEGFQGDGLVDPPPGPRTDALELLHGRLAPALEIAHGNLQPGQRDAVDVSVQEIVVGELVVDDLLAVPLDHPLGDRLQLPRQPAQDLLNHVLPDGIRRLAARVGDVGLRPFNLNAWRLAACHRRPS
jgi:hypothetical protein